MINVANRTLFEGDNLPVLRGLNSECIDLIATDPPFNKGRDFHATPDSLASGAKFADRWDWREEVHKPWVDGLHDELEAWSVIESARLSYGDDMGAFLCFIGVRLLEMRRVLKPTGSIYLHCDPTASHYLKALMDAVFGRKQFRNEIVWCYTRARPGGKQFARLTDTIYWYSKGTEWTFNKEFAQVPLSEEALKVSKIVRKDGTVWERKRSTKDMPNWWADVNLPTGSSERVGYPTQKPLALYDRIIRASSNEGDWVLDPFAGCATTPIAAELAGRNWIGIDLWDGAAEVTRKRLADATGLTGGDVMALFGESHHRKDAPVRTDAGEVAAAFLETPKKGQRRPRLMRDHVIKARLLIEFGLQCWGCSFVAPDDRYLELDHDKPRNAGGSDEIDNRALLCGPCNREKRDIQTLTGLRKRNGVKAHPVNLKGASQWRQQQFEDALLNARRTLSDQP